MESIWLSEDSPPTPLGKPRKIMDELSAPDAALVYVPKGALAIAHCGVPNVSGVRADLMPVIRGTSTRSKVGGA